MINTNNSDEILTYICLILSFINISLWFYVYFIDNNIIQYIIFIFTIFILLFITLIIYIYVIKNSYNNIIIFDEFYYIRIGLIILNLICYSFYIKYFLKDKSNIKKGGGFINKNFIYNGISSNVESYLQNFYYGIDNLSNSTANMFLEEFKNNSHNDDNNYDQLELVFFLFINSIIKKLEEIIIKELNDSSNSSNSSNIIFNKKKFYRILYNYMNDEILFYKL